MNKTASELAVRYHRKINILKTVEDRLTNQYHTSAFNYPKYPVITTDEEIQVFTWGLIPSWVTTEEDAKEMRGLNLNIKAETLFDKAAFRDSILNRRCLIPSSGYFESRYENGCETPYFIFVKDAPIFSMAGIYDIWTDRKTQSSIITFAVIITDSNPLTSYIHNTKRKMPAIIAPEDEERWLDKDLQKDDILSFLRSYPMEKMDAYEIADDYLSLSPDDPSIIRKIAYK